MSTTPGKNRKKSPTRTTMLRCLGWFLLGTAGTLLYLNRVASDTGSFWNNQFFYDVTAVQGGPESDPGDYVLAFGSSLTRTNFIPSAFEKSLADHGREVRTYNLGIPGAAAFEVDYYLRRTLKHLERSDLPPPRYVVIDLRFPFTGFTLEKDRGTQRFADWHTLRNTLGSLESLTIEEGDPSSKLGESFIHLRAMLARVLPFGQMQRALEGTAASAGATVPGEGTGRPPPDRAPTAPVDLSATREQFEQRVARRIERLDAQEPIPAGNARALHRQIRFLLDKGIIPIYYLPPSFGDTRFIRALESRGLIPWLPAYDHPAEYPEHWRYDDRADMPHLQLGEPSERFTRALANDIHEHVLTREAEYREELASCVGR